MARKTLPEPVWRDEPPYTSVANCGPFKLGVFMQQELRVFGEREFEISGPEGLVLRRGLGTTEDLTRQSAYETACELAGEILALADAIRAAATDGAAQDGGAEVG